MKTLPFWMGLIEDKAIFIATIAESVYKFAGSTNHLVQYVIKDSAADGFHSGVRALDHLPRVQLQGLSKLHPVSKVFLLAEFLDMLTTMIGLLVIPKIWEANPIVEGVGGWLQTLLLKFIVMFIVVTVIELMRQPLKIGSVTLISGKLPKAIWIIPVVAGLPVLWNYVVILLELVA
jgi:hypothetical protein